jgi:hypothetical protein
MIATAVWIPQEKVINLPLLEQKDGGADKDRTCDLLNAIQALYQLSYDPIQSGEQFTNSNWFVKINFGGLTSESAYRTNLWRLSLAL